MKLKEALEVLAYAPTVYDAKHNTIYTPDKIFHSPFDYDTMVDKYGAYEVEEISAWHDCQLIVQLKETVDET